MTTRFDVAVMHDFFVDRLVRAKRISSFAASLDRKARQGGGGIHGVAQQDIKGGNAVNLAHALAKLGLRTLLITHSDTAHERILLQPFEALNAEVRVKRKPPGLTVAIEGEVNVMLGHLGGAGDFGQSLLTEVDWEALRGARVVCSVNWAANKRGTQLLLGLREKLGSRAVLFFDPADFRDRAEQFAVLLAKARRARLADWISLNEHEAVEAARLMSLEVEGPGEACAILSRELGSCIDVHSASRCFTSGCDGSRPSRLVSIANRRAEPRRMTGAGDVWNAASIYGRLRGFGDSKRLVFASTAARLYVEAIDPAPPSLSEVLEALG